MHRLQKRKSNWCFRRQRDESPFFRTYFAVANQLSGKLLCVWDASFFKGERASEVGGIQVWKKLCWLCLTSIVRAFFLLSSLFLGAWDQEHHVRRFGTPSRAQAVQSILTFSLGKKSNFRRNTLLYISTVGREKVYYWRGVEWWCTQRTELLLAIQTDWTII